MAVFSSSTPLDKTAAEISKLQQAREKLEAGNLADIAKLAELTAGQADIELAEVFGNRPSKPTAGFPELIGEAKMRRLEIQDIELRIQGRQAARPRLMERIREAIQAHAHARASQLREQAAALRESYDAHVKRRSELLKALHDLDGVDYAMVLQTGKPGHMYGPNEVPMREPRSLPMEREIGRLLAEAAAIEATGSTPGGSITGTTLDELLKVTENPAVLAPTVAEIQRWFATAEANAESEWQRRLTNYAGHTPPAHEVVYVLVWDANATIDPARCSWTIRENRAVDFAAHKAAMDALKARFAPRPGSFGGGPHAA